MHTSPNAPSGRLADSTAGMALCSTTAASHLPLPDESTETGSLENSNTASLFLDTNLRLTRYTDEGPNVLNAPPTALQHIWTDWVPVGCSTTLLAEVQKTLSSAIQCHRVVHANDTWYGVRVAPHHTESNDIAGVVLTFSTLSAPASTTDASIIPSSAVINALDLPVVVLNSTGEVQRVNAAYNAFTGYTADSQVGQPVASLVAASDQPRLAERIQNVMSESCASTVLSLRWRTSEGDDRDMESRCVPLKDTRGVIHGVLLMGLFSPVLDPARHMMSENAAARHHVGEELHESLGMGLAAAAMKMQNLRAAVARGETIRPEALDALTEQMRASAQQARQLSQRLMPVSLQQNRLGEALDDLAREVEDQTGIVCIVRRPDRLPARPSATWTLQVYHIAREAIELAQQHGAPRCIRLTIEAPPHRLVLRVQYDNPTIESPIDADTKLVRDVMRYRARVLGATCSTSHTDTTTVLTCNIPYASA